MAEGIKISPTDSSASKITTGSINYLLNKSHQILKKGCENVSVFADRTIDVAKEINDGMDTEMKVYAGIFGASALVTLGSSIASNFIKNPKILNILKTTGKTGGILGVASLALFSLSALSSNTIKNINLKIKQSIIDSQNSELKKELAEKEGIIQSLLQEIGTLIDNKNNMEEKFTSQNESKEKENAEHVKNLEDALKNLKSLYEHNKHQNEEQIKLLTDALTNLKTLYTNDKKRIEYLELSNQTLNTLNNLYETLLKIKKADKNNNSWTKELVE